jgi:hypothetical protein
MADTFTWHIGTLDRHVADGAVYCSYWSVNAERAVAGEEEPLTAGCYGSVGFGADLTFEQVLEWTKEALGGAEKCAEIEASLSAQLDEKEHPTNEKGLPW